MRWEFPRTDLAKGVRNVRESAFRTLRTPFSKSNPQKFLLRKMFDGGAMTGDALGFSDGQRTPPPSRKESFLKGYHPQVWRRGAGREKCAVF